MSKLLSSVGIGNAEVDTILPTDTVVPGQSIDATVEIEGGSAEQAIEEIYFALVTKYQTEEGYATGTIQKYKLVDDFTIEAGEKRTEAVTIDVPYKTPLTMGRTGVWVETGLDIDWAIDPQDRDQLEVDPDARLEALIDAIGSLGFRFHSADVMASTQGGFMTRSFVQELEFRPREGPFAGRLEDIEVIPVPDSSDVEVVVEVDKRTGLLDEIASWDDSRSSLSFDHADADRLRGDLEAAIENHL
jgi:sporulation-control protein